MQRILPPAQRSILVRQGKWSEEETLSELGIYGTFLRKGSKVGLRELLCGLSGGPAAGCDKAGGLEEETPSQLGVYGTSFRKGSKDERGTGKGEQG